MQEKGWTDFVTHILDLLSILSCLIKNCLVRTAFSSQHLKLSLPMFLKCFLTFVYFQSHISYRSVSYKKKTFIYFINFICVSLGSSLAAL